MTRSKFLDRVGRPSAPFARCVFAAGLLAAGCDAAPTPSEPVALELSALSGTACGDPESPNLGTSPFADASRVTVAIRGTDAATGDFGTLMKRTSSLVEGRPVTIGKVPEGTDREIILFAQGGAQPWYGRESGIRVRRDTNNAATVLLSRFGGFSCVPTPGEVGNGVFAAAVALPDGTVLVTGGFTSVSGDGKAVTGASDRALLFNAKTGAVTALGSMGVARGAHAMVYMPANGKVLIVGGASEIGVDSARPFPFYVDNHGSGSKALDDVIVFDPVARTFTPGTERMLAPRVFPRAAALADGTVVITGGGEWPVPAAGHWLEVDMYDPQDNENTGGFIETHGLRSFYARAGHTLTPIGDGSEQLTELLVWGGTTLHGPAGGIGEVYRQSARQREGVSGTFAAVGIVPQDGGADAPNFVFFHETVKLSGDRFLAVGGAPLKGASIGAPENDEVWLLTYRLENDVPKVITHRLPGLTARVFHTALSPDLTHATIFGGWSALDAVGGADSLVTVDATVSDAHPDPTLAVDATAAALTAPRGGHAAIVTSAGGIFVVGGESQARPGGEAKRLSAEVYVPPYAPTP